MRRSSNEIKTTIYKAVRGSGFPTGIADEISDAALWLYHKGQDAASIIVAGVIQAGTNYSHFKVEGDRLLYASFREVSDGVPALDFLVAHAMANNANACVQIQSLHQPLLLVALASNVARVHGIGFTFICENRELNLSEVAEKLELLEVVSGKPVQVRAFRLAEKLIPLPITSIDVNEVSFADCCALAAKTLVPASEKSRLSGAGASDKSDND